METSIKKQAIKTVRVFIEDEEVYITKGRYQRHHVPLRWVPVVIPK